MEKSILIVDDDASIRDFLSMTLEETYSVKSAENGMKALQILENETFDLVITDLKMPGISGIDVVTWIKEHKENTICIVITAFAGIESAVEAIRKGAYDYLPKPISPDELEIRVEKALEYQDLIQTKNILLKELKGKYGEKNIIGKSKIMKGIFEIVDNISNSKATVLIQGESGTGKELIAKAIHYRSERRDKPFVAINCAALPEGLLESELFGHEKGSFTGAIAQKKGKFELANKGTILLDEISEMPVSLQAKLLRVLQEREIDRVGGNKPIKIDVRVIATTNRDLKQFVAEKKFREDLYYRLNVVPIFVPPLRDRKEDIPLLIDYFLSSAAERNKRKKVSISPNNLTIMLRYDWPGNVRELENFIERIVVMTPPGEKYVPDVYFQPLLSSEEVFSNEKEKTSEQLVRLGMSMEEIEKVMIFKTLELTNHNQTKAAEILGISSKTLRNKLKIYQKEDMA